MPRKTTPWRDTHQRLSGMLRPPRSERPARGGRGWGGCGGRPRGAGRGDRTTCAGTHGEGHPTCTLPAPPPKACTLGAGTPVPCMPPQLPHRGVGGGGKPTSAQPQLAGAGGGSACNPRHRLRVSMAIPPPSSAACSAEHPAAGQPAPPGRAGWGVGGTYFGRCRIEHTHTPPVPMPACSRAPIPHPCPGVPHDTEVQQLDATHPPSPAPRSPVRSGRGTNTLFIGAAAPRLTLGSIFLFFGLDHLPAHRPQLGWENPRERSRIPAGPKRNLERGVGGEGGGEGSVCAWRRGGGSSTPKRQE